MTIARLMALALLAVAAPTAAQTPVREVNLHSFGYTPKVLRLAAGRPVTLAFTNHSGDRHDFTAKNFFARSRIVAGTATGGEVDLRSGETRQVTLVPAAGRYKVHCGHFMHKQFGMTGTIIVE